MRSPQTDDNKHERQYQEIERCRQVKRQSVPNDIPHVTKAECMSFMAADHKDHFRDDKHNDRPQIGFDEIIDSRRHSLDLLHFMQFLIVSVNIQQFVVRTTLHDAAFMQHTDLIGILNR